MREKVGGMCFQVPLSNRLYVIKIIMNLNKALRILFSTLYRVFEKISIINADSWEMNDWSLMTHRLQMQ